MVAGNIARTSMASLYARRVPAIFTWGAILGGFLGWPHVYAAVSNRVHHAPKINMTYI